MRRLAALDLPSVILDDRIARAWAIAHASAEERCAWAPENVDARLIHAMRLVTASVGRVGPALEGRGSPEYVHDPLDIWFQQLAEDYERRKGEKNRVRLRPGAGEVSLMEKAIGWPMTYLDAHDGPRRVLKVWMLCKATRRPFSRACKKIGWARATASRRRWHAALLIATGLIRDRVPLDEIALDVPDPEDRNA
jgi:hypothetical protein